MNNFSPSFLFTERPEFRCLIVGLDAAGKTTILYRMKQNPNNNQEEEIRTIPTIGFNVESIYIAGIEFVAWDSGGRDKLRPLLRHYYPTTTAIIFVIDSTDVERFEHAKDLFHHMVRDEEELSNVAILVLCNKQDLVEDAIPTTEIIDLFDINKNNIPNYESRGIFIQSCSAKTGYGLKEGFEKLAKFLYEKHEKEKEEKKLNYNDDDESSVATMSTEATSTSTTPNGKIIKYNNDDDENKVEFEKYQKLHQSNNITLQRFHCIKTNSKCPFAKSSKLWGGKTFFKDYKGNNFISIEEQAKVHIESFVEFTKQSNAGMDLDGYCIEVFNDDEEATTTTTATATTSRENNDDDDNDSDPEEGLKKFGNRVRRLLTALAANDPSGNNSVMKYEKLITRPGWRFRFYKTDYFVTTFAPCYPSSSSRYTYGINHSFVLFQPDLSFLRHDLPLNTIDTETQWDNPQTIRDKTRIAFRNAGQQYHIPNTIQYSNAQEIVKPLHDDGQSPVIQWWIDPEPSTTLSSMFSW